MQVSYFICISAFAHGFPYQMRARLPQSRTDFRISCNPIIGRSNICEAFVSSDVVWIHFFQKLIDLFGFKGLVEEKRFLIFSTFFFTSPCPFVAAKPNRYDSSLFCKANIRNILT